MMKCGCGKSEVAIGVVIILIVIISLTRFHSAPEPPPRNVRILVAGGNTLNYALLQVDENYLEVIVFSHGGMMCPETNEWFLIGSPLDNTLLDEFSPNFRLPFRNTDRFFGIRNQWSIELSEEQLSDVWRKIDNVVRHYEEPQLVPIGGRLVRAVIDDEFYWSGFVHGEFFHSYNLNFPRRYRRRVSNTGLDLLQLTHFLADLTPLPVNW